MSRCPAMTFVTSDTVCDSTNKCDKDNLCDAGYHCCRTACGGGTECKPGMLFRNYMGLVVRKPVFGVSDQVGHKLACTVIEDS